MTHDDDASPSNASPNPTFGGRPRSACLLITRDGGGPIGGDPGGGPHR
jgi:hypothetical protein